MSMPERFSELADYNARVTKGIAHTAEYRQRMADLQREFNEWQRSAPKITFSPAFVTWLDGFHSAMVRDARRLVEMHRIRR
jgi:hypothetical protein